MLWSASAGRRLPAHAGHNPRALTHARPTMAKFAHCRVFARPAKALSRLDRRAARHRDGRTQTKGTRPARPFRSNTLWPAGYFLTEKSLLATGLPSSEISTL